MEKPGNEMPFTGMPRLPTVSQTPTKCRSVTRENLARNAAASGEDGVQSSRYSA
ncbi:hypothetical protein D3C72_2290370 [compost metagenome]